MNGRRRHPALAAPRLLGPPAPPDAGISEAAFQRLIVDLLLYCGWWVKVDGDSRRTQAGWPDVFGLKPGRALAFEIKTATGRVKRQQRDVGALLATVPGVTYRLVRPRDWDEIVALVTES